MHIQQSSQGHPYPRMEAKLDYIGGRSHITPHSILFLLQDESTGDRLVPEALKMRLCIIFIICLFTPCVVYACYVGSRVCSNVQVHVEARG